MIYLRHVHDPKREMTFENFIEIENYFNMVFWLEDLEEFGIEVIYDEDEDITLYKKGDQIAVNSPFELLNYQDACHLVNRKSDWKVIEKIDSFETKQEKTLILLEKELNNLNLTFEKENIDIKLHLKKSNSFVASESLYIEANGEKIIRISNHDGYKQVFYNTPTIRFDLEIHEIVHNVRKMIFEHINLFYDLEY